MTPVTARSSATKADFDAFVGYFTANSATWQQDNTAPGEGKPTRWVRLHTADGDSSTANVVAVYADGGCEAVISITYRWSSDEQAIQVKGRANSGVALHGTVDPLGGSRYRTAVQGSLPDGTELKMRDTMDLSVPEVSETTAERWANGAWAPLDAVTWRRVPTSAWCEAGLLDGAP